MNSNTLIFEEKRNKYISYLESIGYNNLNCKKEECVWIDYGNISKSEYAIWMCYYNNESEIRILDSTFISKQSLKKIQDKNKDKIVTEKDGYFMVISNKNRVN